MLGIIETMFFACSALFWWKSSQVQIPSLIVCNAPTLEDLSNFSKNKDAPLTKDALNLQQIIKELWEDLVQILTGKFLSTTQNSIEYYIYVTGRLNRNAAVTTCAAIITHIIALVINSLHA